MKVLKNLFYIFLIILSINKIVYASGPSYSLGGYLLRLIIYMLIVLFVVGLAIFGTRFLARSSQKFISSKYMKIIDMLNVGTNAKLLMVEIENYIYIIVITNNSADLIERTKKDEFFKSRNFDKELTKSTLSHINMDKIKEMLKRDTKFNSEEDRK